MKLSIARLALGLGLLSGPAAWATDAYPSKPIRVIVPYAAGGVVWRWKDGAKEGAAGSDLQRVLVLPLREKVDRAEGFTLFDASEAATSILVVYDTPDQDRLDKEGNKGSVTADVFRLP